MRCCRRNHCAGCGAHCEGELCEECAYWRELLKHLDTLYAMTSWLRRG